MGGFEHQGRLIGTMRAVPLGQGLAPADAALHALPPLPPAQREGGWEIGRLVFDPQERVGYDELKQCMRTAFLYMVAHADFRNGFALCTPPLARLYRRWGFNPLKEDAVQGQGQAYALIHGSVPSVLSALAGAPLRVATP